MADATETKQAEEISILAKLSLGTMGIKGAAILGQPAEVKSLKVATFFGKASGVKTVEDKLTGEIHKPLTGTFVGLNHLDHDKEYQSGVLYLPTGTHEMLSAPVEKLMDEADDVEFAVEVYAVRSGNKAGYSYECKPRIEAKAVDPLADLRAKLRGNFVKTIEAPKVEAPAATAKPEPVKAAPATAKK